MTTLPARVKWILVCLAALVLVAIWGLFQLRPPASLTLASGPVDGAYHRVAVRYKSILARDGIEVKILDTEGSLDNLAQLSAHAVDAAILQGGLDVRNLPVEAIAKIFLEPVLFLSRPGFIPPANPALWRDLVINRGELKSGSAAAFKDFQRVVGLPADANVYTDLGYSNALDALADGDIDVGIFVTSLDAPYLAKAYDQPMLGFLQLGFIQAISRRWEHAKVATLPAGAMSLNPVIPDEPVSVLALEAHLAVRDDLHPALVNRLTMATLELHTGPSILSEQQRFPAVTDASFPMNGAARQIIRNGPSAWHEFLPYWLAAQVNRVFILLLPLIVILVPLLRALPAAYSYAMNFRVWQHYPRMRAIEAELTGDNDAEKLDRMEQELTQLDRLLAQLRQPAPFRQTAYHARLHIELLQKRIALERNRLT